MAELLSPPARNVTAVRTVAVRGRSVLARPDRLAGEEPMEIRAAGPGQAPVSVAVTMRTPGNDEELAVGFLHSEGLLDPNDVVSVELASPAEVAYPDNAVTVRLATPFDANRVAARHFVASASCGICGKASLDDVEVRCGVLPPGPSVPRTVLGSLPDRLREAQRIFQATGGLHASGLFDPEGRLLTVREDVGRHNALDKCIGAMFLAGKLPLRQALLMVSGRVSFEIVQKAATAGIPIVCAVSAPTDLAVDAATRVGMTLVGFLRGDGFNIYCGAERIELEG